MASGKLQKIENTMPKEMKLITDSFHSKLTTYGRQYCWRYGKLLMLHLAFAVASDAMQTITANTVLFALPPGTYMSAPNIPLMAPDGTIVAVDIHDNGEATPTTAFINNAAGKRFFMDFPMLLA